MNHWVFFIYWRLIVKGFKSKSFEHTILNFVGKPLQHVYLNGSYMPVCYNFCCHFFLFPTWRGKVAKPIIQITAQNFQLERTLSIWSKTAQSYEKKKKGENALEIQTYESSTSISLKMFKSKSETNRA